MFEIDFAREEAEYLKSLDRMQDQAERRHFMALLAHPCCSDPDHPGCENCDEE